MQEGAGVSIGDRRKAIYTPDGGAGTAESAVRYDNEKGMRSLNDAEKDHVYGKVGADGERSGGVTVSGFNQSIQGVTSNNALSRGEVGSLARDSGMSRSESKNFAKELTGSKVGSEVNEPWAAACWTGALYASYRQAAGVYRQCRGREFL